MRDYTFEIDNETRSIADWPTAVLQDALADFGAIEFWPSCPPACDFRERIEIELLARSMGLSGE